MVVSSLLCYRGLEQRKLKPSQWVIYLLSFFQQLIIFHLPLTLLSCLCSFLTFTLLNVKVKKVRMKSWEDIYSECLTTLRKHDIHSY